MSEGPPFSRLAIEICLNLVTLFLMLEQRPWQPRPPWRTRRQHLVIWLVSGLAIVLLTDNLSHWLILYLFNNQHS